MRNKRELSTEWQAVYARIRYYRSVRKLKPKTLKRLAEIEQILKSGLKECRDCGEYMAIENFYVIPASRDGLSVNCRECRSSIASENYHQRKRRNNGRNTRNDENSNRAR